MTTPQYDSAMKGKATLSGAMLSAANQTVNSIT